MFYRGTTKTLSQDGTVYIDGEIISALFLIADRRKSRRDRSEKS